MAVALPPLVSKHTLPLATFYGEWASALAFVVLVLWSARLRAVGSGVPLVAAFCLWLIALGAGATLVGQPDVTGSRSLTLAALLLGTGAIWAGHRYRRALDAEAVLTAFATAWVAAGLFGTLAQWVQLFRLEGDSFGLVSDYFYDANRRLWGNLNQPNHQATVHGLALAASVWLASRGKLRALPWIVAVVLIESGVVLSGSRTGVLHVGLAACYALVAAWLARSAQQDAAAERWTLRAPAGLVFAAAALVAMLMLLQPAIKTAGQAFGWSLFDTMAQLQAGDQISARGALWAHAWAMFVAHPWFGVGWGEFGWAQFEQMARLGVIVEMSLHAHNAVLDLLAKTGIVGTAGVALFLAAWLWRVVRTRLWRADTAERARTAAALTWLAMLCAHSMLEYPLHYLYFLLPFCFLLGWLEPAALTVARMSRPLATAGTVVVGVAAALVLATMWQDYRRVEAREYASPARVDTLPAPHLWFGQHAEAHRAELAPLTADGADAWLPPHIAAIHLLPTPTMIARGAWLLALNGEPEQGREWLERLRYYYRGDEAAQFARVAGYCDGVDAARRPNAFCEWIQRRRADKAAPRQAGSTAPPTR
ncbi:O-antigen ligase C-terminal domain-containing protein [Cupriavidus gilardii]|uniref:PglL family O-oligosaccharyltransferase n=1 Tax=Cupriavidus gilardii TaxID=82541 RepID=UPI001ABDBC93|nr:O-antigen ligase family protein [Cupriavidus gilardii]MBO4121416.1 O-antigen ligase C-terminal domain-containing protein [Cupriavidus gilardii]